MNKIKSYTNHGIIAVVMGIILSIAQKHNRLKIEHNRLGLTAYAHHEKL